MGSNIKLESNIGKNKKPNNKIILTLVIGAVVIIALAVGYKIFRKSNITEIAVGLSDIELNDELKANMVELAKNANSYFNENKAESSLTSQYGLLYNYKDKVNVLPADLSEDINISSDILAEMDILYVKPGDIINTLQGDELKIFVSVNSISGYCVVSPEGEEALFTEEEFKNILMKYAPTHGDITNPQRGSDEHRAIITAAGLEGSNVDIKHIACDSKYAVVVGGSISNPSDIKEAALIKEDNVWNVVSDKLASSENSYIEINKLCPDMDLGLMPIYNISDFGEIQTDKMGEVADSLIELGMMTEADKETMYACGSGRFAYIQLENGKRLVGYINDEKQLEFNEAANISEVISYMLQRQENPPVIIARFE